MTTTTLRPAPTVTLANGIEMPRLGLGTWPLKDDAATQAVAGAIAMGYRLIDTAENYANEEAVGAGIRQGGVARDALFITTKFNRKWHSVEGAQEAAKASLKRLGLDYIDLLLIHWPNPDQGRFVEAFEGITRAVEAGLVRAAGVSNFTEAHLQKLFDAGFTPAVNQIELDPTRPRTALAAFNAAHGIVTEAWSPLGRGEILNHPAVRDIAAAHGVTPGQAVLRWHMQKGYVTMPKSADPARQAQNLDVFGFRLEEAEMSALDAMADPGAGMTDPDTFGH